MRFNSALYLENWPPNFINNVSQVVASLPPVENTIRADISPMTSIISLESCLGLFFSWDLLYSVAAGSAAVGDGAGARLRR